jgi:uncharacterized repeat protein (TIGR03803 family)
VFKLNLDGSGFTVLKAGTPSTDGTGNLMLSDSTLYGVTFSGGLSNRGTVFQLNTDGTDYRILKHFSVEEGFSPKSGLSFIKGTLYGTTVYGGDLSGGTIFRLNTNGSDYRILKHFAGPDGSDPGPGLTLSGETLYGTTAFGGRFDGGTLFKFELHDPPTPVPLTAQTAKNVLVLSWENPAFSLQSAPESTGAYATIQGATSPHTNALSEPHRFYRLIGP